MVIIMRRKKEKIIKGRKERIMKKKIVLLTLTAVLACSMVACKSTNKGNDSDASASPSATASIDEAKMLSADLTGYVTLGEYKGLTIEEVSDTVTDKQVEAKINSTLQDNTTWDEQDKNYKAKKTDKVNIDYVGKVDGTAFDGGTAEGVDIVLGSSGYIDGFDDGVIGHKTGETFDINVTFPESYQKTDLAGKDAVFTITLNKVSKQNVPELTDKYVASTLSKTSKTVAEYKKEVRKSLETAAKEKKAQQEATNAVQAAIEKATVKEYPSDQMDYYKSIVTNYYNNMATAYGMTVEDLYKTYNYTAETWESEIVTKSAQDMLKQVMVVQAIAKQENITVSDEDYKEKLDYYLKAYNAASEDELKQSFGDAVDLNIKQEVLYSKVGEFLVKNDKVVKAAATATPAPTATAEAK